MQTVLSYLGAKIDKQGRTASNIRARLGKARVAFNKLDKVWKSSQRSWKTKIMIFKTNILLPFYSMDVKQYMETEILKEQKDGNRKVDAEEDGQERPQLRERHSEERSTRKENISDSGRGGTQKQRQKTELLGREGLVGPFSTRRVRKDNDDDFTPKSSMFHRQFLFLSHASLTSVTENVYCVKEYSQIRHFKFKLYLVATSLSDKIVMLIAERGQIRESGWLKLSLHIFFLTGTKT